MEIITIIAIMVLAVAGIIFLPRLMVKRALNRIVKAFLQGNAVGAQNAKTPEELRLAHKKSPLSFFRDYSMHALSMLMKSGVIKTEEGGKLYFSEECLASTKVLSKRCGNS